MNLENLKAGFKYLIEVLRPDGTVDESQTEIVHNLMPTEGLNFDLSVLLANGSPVATWFVGLFHGNYTPVSGDTMAAFPGAASETTTSYNEATRQAFTPGTIAGGAVDNSASPASFTFNETKTVYGGFIGSSSAKGATTGVLLSAVRFASAKQLSSGGILRVTAGFTLTSV